MKLIRFAVVMAIATSSVFGVSTRAHAAEFTISNVSVPAHTGIATLVFEVTGSIPMKFTNCYDMMSTLRPLVKLTDDQGARTLQVAASWGLTAKTLAVFTNGLRCEIETAEPDSYNFGPTQEQTQQTYELIFGIYSATGQTTLLNRSQLTVAPQIISPTRGQDVPGFAILKFSGDLDPKFKLVSRKLIVCAESCPAGQNFVTYVDSFKDSRTAYVVFDNKQTEGKPIEIRAQWFYTNPAGILQYTERAVTVNVKGSGSSNPVSKEFMANFDRAALEANMSCVPPSRASRSIKCFARPTFNIIKTEDGLWASKDFSASYRSTLKIQTSTDGKAWKSIRSASFETGSQTPFSVPFSTKYSKFYIRAVSNGIPIDSTPTAFYKRMGNIVWY